MTYYAANGWAMPCTPSSQDSQCVQQEHNSNLPDQDLEQSGDFHHDNEEQSLLTPNNNKTTSKKK